MAVEVFYFKIDVTFVIFHLRVEYGLYGFNETAFQKHCLQVGVSDHVLNVVNESHHSVDFFPLRIICKISFHSFFKALAFSNIYNVSSLINHFVDTGKLRKLLKYSFNFV
ncbi:hypothetical protein SDC9_58635 [bioreactor metagenome]|uniref:Uncharacterized protein n=1 Tax=bioreactor metagenome TaxID=1076179 RepID=A0A644XDM0_9ZZZZ